jgi:alkylation response protein AidB-like acyl-CoA dehydrogenase
MTDTADLQEAIARIRASAEGLADARDLTRVRRLRYAQPGFDRSVWRSMCELGWPALRTPEDRGGVGLGMAAYCALAETLGAALAPEPLIGAVLAAALLEDDALADLLSGVRLALPAWQSGRDQTGPAVDLRRDGGKLFGRKAFVPMAGGADALLVIEPDRSWLVDVGAPGVELVLEPTQDGGFYGVATFHGADGRPITADPRPAIAGACLATSAYLLGLMEAALGRTIDYLGARVQFGQPIGAFQALQHRAVDLRLQVELTRASVEDAAARWDAAPGAAAGYAAISRAKVRAATAAMLVTRQAVQLHGGIGFTDEHDIGLYLRKAMVVAPQFGGPALHRTRFAALSPAPEAC